ncbi:MAG: hypothetical protein ABIH50_06690 [bacterium]
MSFGSVVNSGVSYVEDKAKDTVNNTEETASYLAAEASSAANNTNNQVQNALGAGDSFGGSNNYASSGIGGSGNPFKGLAQGAANPKEEFSNYLYNLPSKEKVFGNGKKAAQILIDEYLEIIFPAHKEVQEEIDGVATPILEWAIPKAQDGIKKGGKALGDAIEFWNMITNNDADNEDHGETHEYYTIHQYSVKDDDGNYHNEYTVEDKNGETHTFSSREEAEAFIEQDSAGTQGAFIVRYVSASGGTHDEFDVYVDGKLVERSGDRQSAESYVSEHGYQYAENPCAPNSPEDVDKKYRIQHEQGEGYDDYVIYDDRGNVVAIFDSQESADAWIIEQKNKWHDNADTSYLTEYNSINAINSGSSDAEMAAAIDGEMTTTMDGFDEKDFYYFDEEGKQHIDGERLAAFAQKISVLCGLTVAISMLMKAENEKAGLVHQEMTGVAADKGLDTDTIIAKYVQNKQKIVTIFMTELVGATLDQLEAWYKETQALDLLKLFPPFAIADYLSGGILTIGITLVTMEQTSKYLDAVNEVLSTMRQILTAQRQEDDKKADEEKAEEKKNDRQELDKKLQRAQENMANEGVDSVTYRDKAGYSHINPDQMSDLRQRFYGLGNLRRAWMMLAEEDDTQRNMIHEEMTGVGGRERSQSAKRLSELESSRDLMLFETTINLSMRKMNLENTRKYQEYQVTAGLIKLPFNVVANGLTVLATAPSLGFGAAALVCMMFPATAWLAPIFGGISAGWGIFVGLPLGIAAAAIRLTGEGLAYLFLRDHRYQEEPTETEQTEHDTNTGNEDVDTWNQTANAEEKTNGKANEENTLDIESDPFGWLQENVLENGPWPSGAHKPVREKTVVRTIADRVRKDTGFEIVGGWHVDSKQVGELQKPLNRIQNLRRVLWALHKEKASLRKLVHLEMTGKGGRENSDLVENAMEAEFMLAQFKLEMAVFLLNEVATSRNMEFAQNQQMVQAILSFILTITLETAGASAGMWSAATGVGATKGGATAILAAAGIGASLGMQAGAAVAGAVSVGASKSVDAVQMMTDYLEQYVLREIFKKDERTGTEAKIDQTEAQIYEELMTNGVTTNNGDMYWNLNNNLIKELRKRLMRIAYTREAIAKLTAAKAEARNLVHVEMTGVSGRRPGALVNSVNQAEFEKTMKVFDSLVQLQAQKVEAHKRHVDAARDIAISVIKTTVNLSLISITALACWAFGSPAAGIMAAVTSLVNSGLEFLISQVKTALSLFTIAQIAKRELTKKKENDKANDATLGRLDESEADVYASVSYEMVEGVGGGRLGISNGAMALLQHKMDKIFNIRDVVAKLRAAQAELRNQIHATMTGVSGRPTQTDQAFAYARTIAFGELGATLKNLETLIERINEISEDQRSAVLSMVQMTVAVMELVIAIASAKNENGQKEISDKFEEGGDLFSVKKELDNKEARIADLEKIIKEANKTKKDVSKEMLEYKDLMEKIEPLRKKVASFNEPMEVLRHEAEKFRHLNFAISMMEMTASQLVSDIVDKNLSLLGRTIGSKKRAYNKELDKDSEEKNGRQKGVAASGSRLETSSVRSQISSGDMDLNLQAAEYESAKNDDMIAMLQRVIDSTAKFLLSLKKPDKAATNYLVGDKNKRMEDGLAVPVGAAPVEPQAPKVLAPQANPTPVKKVEAGQKAEIAKVTVDQTKIKVQASAKDVNHVLAAMEKEKRGRQESWRDDAMKLAEIENNIGRVNSTSRSYTSV